MNSEFMNGFMIASVLYSGIWGGFEVGVVIAVMWVALVLLELTVKLLIWSGKKVIDSLLSLWDKFQSRRKGEKMVYKIIFSSAAMFIAYVAIANSGQPEVAEAQVLYWGTFGLLAALLLMLGFGFSEKDWRLAMSLT